MGLEQKVATRRNEAIEYMHKHPIRDMIRTSIEPGYALRSALKIFPRGNPQRRKNISNAVSVEVIRLGALAYMAYLAYQAFN